MAGAAMGLGTRIAIALSLLVGAGTIASEHRSEAASGADLAAACAPATAVPEVGPRACTSLQAGAWLAAGACRRVEPLQDPVCPTLDGRRVSEGAMADFEASWLARALALQSQLDLDVPLTQALLPHTHNSANSTAYAPSVTTLDANQVLTITDQLRLGMRAIEIDIHWAHQPDGDPANGFRAVVQCHGEPTLTPAGMIHAGCSVDQPLVDLLHELQAWLDLHPDEFVLLYLENALDGEPTAHAEAVAAIEAALGDSALGGLVARPTIDDDTTCESLPVTRSKRDIVNRSGQVLITGNCGPSGWDDWVFERGDHWDESGGSDFTCPDDRYEGFDSTLVRRYEDSTWLSGMAGSGSHRDADTIEAMVRCGVNLVGFDQLHPGDERLERLVWSWRADQPTVGASGMCAAQGADARFFADGCTTAHKAACRTPGGGWAVSPDPVAWADATAACAGLGQLDVPVNGWDNHELRAEAGAANVWLAYRQVGSTWTTGTA